MGGEGLKAKKSLDVLSGEYLIFCCIIVDSGMLGGGEFN